MKFPLCAEEYSLTQLQMLAQMPVVEVNVSFFKSGTKVSNVLLIHNHCTN